MAQICLGMPISHSTEPTYASCQGLLFLSPVSGWRFSYLICLTAERRDLLMTTMSVLYGVQVSFQHSNCNNYSSDRHEIICFRVRVWSWLFINLLLLNQNEANIMCICTHIKV